MKAFRAIILGVIVWIIVLSCWIGTLVR